MNWWRGVLREMKKNKYVFVFCMLLAIALAGGIFTKAYRSLESGTEGGRLQVVASFYPIYIAALNVVGGEEAVELQNLSEPQTGCLHDYQLKPQDMMKISNADLFLVNGGGIEGFLAEVGEAYPQLSIAEVTEGIALLEGNAHAWMDTRLYAEMVQNIAKEIGALDAGHAADYQRNADAYCKKVEALSDQIAEIQAYFAERGERMPEVILFHEAYDYVAGQYGFETAYCMDLDEERQISAREVADVLGEIEEHQVKAAFAEALYGKDMGDAIEAESDCKVCYLDTLVRGEYDADSYLSAMQENIDKIRQLFIP